MVATVRPRVAGSRGLRFEGEALAFWADTGAVVALHDRRDYGFTLILERRVPGGLLVAIGLGVVDTLAELGRLAASLHAAGPPPAGWNLPGPAPGVAALSAHPILRDALGRVQAVDPPCHEALLHGILCLQRLAPR